MKKKFCVSLSIILLILSFFNLQQVHCASKAAAFVEINSGRVLYQYNADQKLPMASTTKIMTALIALEEGDLESLVKVSKTAQGVEGSSMYLKEGDILTLYDLITGLMYFSANDGAVAIAEHISGSVENFNALMNKKAIELGCTDTNFKNPNGLPDDEHYTTAYDLARITAYALKNEKFKEIVESSKAVIILNGVETTIYNKNKFLNLYDYAIGVKTGYTKAAGRCFVSAAQKDGMIICGVVLDSDDMYGESENILEKCYTEYHLEVLIKKGKYLCSIPVSGGSKSVYQVTMPNDLTVPLKDGEIKNIKIISEFTETLTAPVTYQYPIGKIEVHLNDEIISTQEIYTDHTVNIKIPFLKIFTDEFKYIITEIL